MDQEGNGPVNDFTASNGNTFRRYEDHVVVRTRSGMKLIGSSTIGRDLAEYTEHVAAEALAKRDAVIGRWRWPQNPDYVVYRTDHADSVRVIRESDGIARHYNLTYAASRPFDRAGRGYFDSLPEPKPWDAAKPGEVWALRFEDDSEEFAAVKYDNRWKATEGGWPNEDLITAGRRIWPESDQ
jgi:hypothetical protein